AYDPPKRRSPPRMYLLSVGVDDYRDAQIPKLATAVQSTRDFVSVVQRRSSPLYRVDAASLLNDRATKSSWRYLADDFVQSVKDGLTPDDLLVVYLSGHGVKTAEGDGYQFVTSNARYADVLSGKYAACLTLEDFTPFAEVACRKLVILNTCHGGAIQPLIHRDLKAAVRKLQNDLLITIAASGGNQEAVEGRFANRLLQALEGADDDDGDGIISLNEMVAYVQRTVAADSDGEPVRQTPSAGPAELLRYAALRLATTDRFNALGYVPSNANQIGATTEDDRPNPTPSVEDQRRLPIDVVVRAPPAKTSAWERD
ncbi:MAG: caspase family protein, partial [Planctomycetota bacterium]